MAKVAITPDKLTKAIEQELTLYNEGVEEKLRKITRESMKELIDTTRVTAPFRTGDYRRSITGDFRGLAKGLQKISALWYVKAPHYRLTHLLVHGHAKAGGGRVEGDPFLQNALDDVLPKFQEAIEEAIKNGK